MTDNKFIARSASDRTDDWPSWMIVRADNRRTNVTRDAVEIAGMELPPGAVFLERGDAELIADLANQKIIPATTSRRVI